MTKYHITVIQQPTERRNISELMEENIECDLMIIDGHSIVFVKENVIIRAYPSISTIVKIISE